MLPLKRGRSRRTRRQCRYPAHQVREAARSFGDQNRPCPPARNTLLTVAAIRLRPPPRRWHTTPPTATLDAVQRDLHMTRLSSQHRPVRRQSPAGQPVFSRCRRHAQPVLSALTLLLARLGCLLISVSAATAQSTLPPIDFEQLGDTVFVGSFAGIGRWTPPLPGAVSAQDDSNSCHIMVRASNGSLYAFAAANPGGSVEALCEMPAVNTTHAQPPTLYAAGNFTSIAGVHASNIARWKAPASSNSCSDGGSWTSLGRGLAGPVHTLYCDVSTGVVIAGGDFPGGLSRWDMSSEVWTTDTLLALNGSVLRVAAGMQPNVTSIAGALTSQYVSLSSNQTPSLVTSVLRPVSMSGVQIRASSAQSGDPATLLCPVDAADGTNAVAFLWPDALPGMLHVDLLRTVSARALRLGNTFVDGHGIGNFSLTVSSSSAPLKLLYVDPATGRNATCSTACPLMHSRAIPYQDFLLDDAEASPHGFLELDSFSLSVESWVGQGAGLHLLQLLGPGTTVYANQAYNRANCTSVQPDSGLTLASVSVSGDWSTTVAAIRGTKGSMGMLRSTRANSSMTFVLNILIDGNYTVYTLFTGCNSLSTACESGTVTCAIDFNLSYSRMQRTFVTPSSSPTLVQVYDGPMAASSSRWSPSVTITVTTGHVSILRVDAVLRNSTFLPAPTAQGFGFLDADLSYDKQSKTSINLTLSAGLLNAAAAGLSLTGLQAPSFVAAYAVEDNTVYAGGHFHGTTLGNSSSAGSNFTNLVSLQPSSIAANLDLPLVASLLPGGGLDGAVYTLKAWPGSGLFVGGNFTSTADGQTALSYAALYDFKERQWDSLAGGLVGPVFTIEPLGTDALIFLGSFSTNSADAHPGRRTTGANAVWNTSTHSWMDQRSLTLGTFAAGVPANFTSPLGLANASYLSGRITAWADKSAAGVVALSPSFHDTYLPDILPLNISPSTNKSAADAGRGGHSGVSATSFWGNMHAAAFWSGLEGDTVVIGGEFSSGNATNLGIYRLDPKENVSREPHFAAVQPGELMGLPPYPSGNLGTVNALTVENDTLFVGFVGGMAVLDLRSDTWVTASPLIDSRDNRGTAVVRRIARRPGTHFLIIAGSFDSAGDQACDNICLLDTRDMHWSTLPGLSGNVSDVDFTQVSLQCSCAWQLARSNARQHVHCRRMAMSCLSLDRSRSRVCTLHWSGGISGTSLGPRMDRLDWDQVRYRVPPHLSQA